jgi:hypothetical protein
MVSGFKREEGTGDRKRLYSDELYGLNMSPNLTGVITRTKRYLWTE